MSVIFWAHDIKSVVEKRFEDVSYFRTRCFSGDKKNRLIISVRVVWSKLGVDGGDLGQDKPPEEGTLRNLRWTAEI